MTHISLYESEQHQYNEQYEDMLHLHISYLLLKKMRYLAQNQLAH